jgi:hypothetical protein
MPSTEDPRRDARHWPTCGALGIVPLTSRGIPTALSRTHSCSVRCARRSSGPRACGAWSHVVPKGSGHSARTRPQRGLRPCPLDIQWAEVHTPGMGGSPKRLVVADARGHGGSLRITRHPQQRKVVLSHWREGVCVASTPVEISELPGIIGVLADALGDAASLPGPPPRRRGLWLRLRHLLRPTVAASSILLTAAREETAHNASPLRVLASGHGLAHLNEEAPRKG